MSQKNDEAAGTASTSAPTNKKLRAPPTHPPTSVMVLTAIKELKERNGSSLAAVKKYMAANYEVDIKTFTPFIRKYVKSAIKSGELIQTKGKGAVGSFKLPAGKEKKQATAKPKNPATKESGKKGEKLTKAKETTAAKKKKITVADDAETMNSVAAPKEKIVKAKTKKARKSIGPSMTAIAAPKKLRLKVTAKKAEKK